jgi:HKD family nuclease
MDTVLQSPLRPTEVLYALQSLVDRDTDRVRIAVAYTTYKGCATLFPSLAALIGSVWESIPKTLITSLDFGHTDPGALEYVTAIPNFDVRITNANLTDAGVRLMPAESNFHPKIYLFGEHPDSYVLVGSPNLSDRALTASTEAAALLVAPEELEDYWDELVEASTTLTDDILTAYKAARPKRKAVDPDPPLATIPPAANTGALPVLGDAITLGEVDPSEYECFWVEAGSMRTGGSHNQLELPRGANHFFDFDFSSYDDAHHIIGWPVLLTPGRDPWTDRKLTWHGNNRMERINLPTQHQSGLSYPGTAVLFRRTDDGFFLQVSDWDSEVAKSWRNASAELDRTYRLGTGTNRLCGLF